MRYNMAFVGISCASQFGYHSTALQIRLKLGSDRNERNREGGFS